MDNKHADPVSVEILSRWDSAKVLFSASVDADIPLFGRIKAAVELALRNRANLRDANLGGADLGGANLRDANLRDANLGGANLRDADLGGANLRGANLRDAYLGGANLRGANLRDADLRGANLGGADLGGADLGGANLGGANLRDADLGGANLRGANLRGAYLRGANLGDADLRAANLGAIKQDLIAEVLRLPNELDALRSAIIAGRIDGSSYNGECACLAGTLARASGAQDYDGHDIMQNGVTFHTDSFSPRERWFLNIKIGDTPDTSNVAAITLGWVDEAIAIRDNIRSTAPSRGA